MSAIDKLKEMIHKPFIYKNEEVVVIGYCDGVGEDGTDVEIYLNTGRTLEFSMFDLEQRLGRFRPVTNTVIVLANERLNAVSAVNPSIINEVRDTIMEQIRKVKESPDAILQANSIYQGVNSLINVAKTELEYRKYMDKNIPPKT